MLSWVLVSSAPSTMPYIVYVYILGNRFPCLHNLCPVLFILLHVVHTTNTVWCKVIHNVTNPGGAPAELLPYRRSKRSRRRRRGNCLTTSLNIVWRWSPCPGSWVHLYWAGRPPPLLVVGSCIGDRWWTVVGAQQKPPDIVHKETRERQGDGHVEGADRFLISSDVQRWYYFCRFVILISLWHYSAIVSWNRHILLSWRRRRRNLNSMQPILHSATQFKLAYWLISGLVVLCQWTIIWHMFTWRRGSLRSALKQQHFDKSRIIITIIFISTTTSTYLGADCQSQCYKRAPAEAPDKWAGHRDLIHGILSTDNRQEDNW